MYLILTTYGEHGTEEVDCAETREEAEYLLGEYQLAFGSDSWLWIEEEE